MNRRINEFSNLVIAYDSTKKVELGDIISNLKMVLDFSRLSPIITFDQDSSKVNDLIAKIEKYLDDNKDVTEITIMNFYTDMNLVDAWKDKGFTNVKLINMPTVPREKLLDPTSKGVGSMIQSESAELPTDLIADIGNAQDPVVSGLSNKDFSLSSIQLYEMCRLYYIIGKEELDDFTSGSDIVFFAYKNNKYYTIYSNTAGDKIIKVSLNQGNRLVGLVDYGEIDSSGTIKDNDQYEPVVGVSYLYVDGLPKELICNQLLYENFTKPDAINIILFSYRNFFSKDEKIIGLSKSDKNLGYAFQAAKNSVNSGVYIYIYI